LVTKAIFVPNVGEVSIVRRKNCRRLIISVTRNCVVKISVPYKVSFSTGENFLFEKIDWIKDSLSKIKERNMNTISKIEEHTSIQTQTITIKLAENQSTNLSVLHSDKESIIQYPRNFVFSSEQSQSKLKKIIIEILRKEAKDYLVRRTLYLANVNGFSINSVKIRNSRTRWGSCSNNNTINLSLHLIRLPKHLSDYVILHELVHTGNKSHKKSFWEQLEKYYPDATIKSKELRCYRLQEDLF
jgi:predicted metal-dependent hydrolase